MQEKSGNISMVHFPHRVKSLKRLNPLWREEKLEIFHPSRDHRALEWEASQGFVPDSQRKHLPAHTWKLQMSQSSEPGDKHLCVGTSQSQIISQHLCPGDVTQGLLLPGTISQQGGDKGRFCPFFDIRFYRSKETMRKKRKKIKICFLTSRKLKKKRR